nr:hypothetical protein [Rhodococcus qingshengii]
MDQAAKALNDGSERVLVSERSDQVLLNGRKTLKCPRLHPHGRIEHGPSDVPELCVFRNQYHREVACSGFVEKGGWDAFERKAYAEPQTACAQFLKLSDQFALQLRFVSNSDAHCEHHPSSVDPLGGMLQFDGMCACERHGSGVTVAREEFQPQLLLAEQIIERVVRNAH